MLSVRHVLQALQCVEGLLAGMPQAQVALMEASLPLREGGTVSALQVHCARSGWICCCNTFSPLSLSAADISS